MNAQQIDDHSVTEAMLLFGGSFTQLLGALWRQADTENRARIKTAWPEAWAIYGELFLMKLQREEKAARAPR